MDLMALDSDKVRQKRFSFVNDEGERKTYIQVKIQTYKKDGNDKTILQFIDVTKNVLQEQFKVQNELLEMINACISHELRNPLNSIKAQIEDQRSIFSLLERS